MILGSGLLGLAFLQHESSLPANVLVIARGVPTRWRLAMQRMPENGSFWRRQC